MTQLTQSQPLLGSLPLPELRLQQGGLGHRLNTLLLLQLQGRGGGGRDSGSLRSHLPTQRAPAALRWPSVTLSSQPKAVSGCQVTVTGPLRPTGSYR